jgi:Na+/phosphate symporter
MKDKRVFSNPFRMLSPKLDYQSLRMEELHKKDFAESVSVEEAMLITVSKVIEMSKLLSKCLFSGSDTQMDLCDALAAEIHKQEKLLTTDLLEATVGGKLPKGLIRFPFRLERMGDLLENILKCSRVKARDGIPFSDKAHAEMDRIFDLLVRMLGNLRDAFKAPNKVLLESILADVKSLAELLTNARFGHWDRLERGFCAIQASAIYLDILDSLGGVNSYINKMSETLMEVVEEP